MNSNLSYIRNIMQITLNYLLKSFMTLKFVIKASNPKSSVSNWNLIEMRQSLLTEFFSATKLRPHVIQ